MKKTCFATVCAVMFTCFCVYAQDAAVSAQKEISADSILLQQKLPDAPAGKKSFTVVKTETVPYPESWKSLSQPEIQLRLFNILSRISTQKGITYISRRAGYKQKVLFEKSYYIDSPAKKDTILSDPVCTEMPQQTERFVEQDDSTFGDNIYQHTITNTENETLLEVTNRTPLKYHGITCLSTQELTMYTSVVQTPEGIVLSAATRVYNHDKTIRILFIHVDIADSFSRRIDALFTWYKNQLNLEK